MMKKFALLAFCFVPLNSWGASGLDHTVTLLESVYETMEEIKSDLPFAFIKENFKSRAIEARFTRANRKISSSTDLIVERPKQALTGLKEALEEFEAVGFLLPFHEKEEEAFKVTFKAYQQALNNVRLAIKLISDQ